MSTKFLSEIQISLKDIIVIIGLIVPGIVYCSNLSATQDKILSQQLELMQTIKEGKTDTKAIVEKVNDLNSRVSVVRSDVDNLLNGKIVLRR